MINWRAKRARDLSTPPYDLANLSLDTDSVVRRVVALNPSTPPSALAHLSKDTNDLVRWCAAGNPNTPPDVLGSLMQDIWPPVCRALTLNLSTPYGIWCRDDLYHGRILP